MQCFRMQMLAAQAFPAEPYGGIPCIDAGSTVSDAARLRTFLRLIFLV